ncbi:MAG TPA: hypothetical protein VFZ34_28635 [Blastocatellia bacterium]|nr:hypothetical protein [Blastocatellia bacterium]
MSNQTWKKLAFSILTTALMVAFVSAFTQKPGKTADIALRDVLEKTARNKVRLKDPSKFELLVVNGKFAVREKSTRRLVKGTVGCGTCPGGDCKGTDIGNCEGCGKKSGEDLCTIDPF